jgi:hypothetical protein
MQTVADDRTQPSPKQYQHHRGAQVIHALHPQAISWFARRFCFGHFFGGGFDIEVIHLQNRGAFCYRVALL